MSIANPPLQAQISPSIGPRTNRCCVRVAQRKLQICEREVPANLGEDEILIEIISTGICGSDIHNLESDAIDQPLVLGHESAGLVVGVGNRVTSHKVGDRVAIEPGLACMKCEFCLRGNPNICANLKYCGIAPTDGTLCQYVKTPSHMAIPIPDAVSWEEAGCIQPLAIAVQLGRRANIRPHQTVAVFGCGPLGLMVMAVAKAYGVAKIIAFDVEPSRVSFSTEYCADVGVLCPRKDPEQESMTFATNFVKKSLFEQGVEHGVDVAIEASGAEACMQMAVVAAKPGCTVVQAGLGGTLSAVPMFQVTAKELTIRGEAFMARTVRFTPGCYADAIDLLTRKRVTLAPLITYRFPLTKSIEAFEAQQARKGIKIVIMNQE
ncbi:MAG: hypothetical protein M1820_010880 [Bogoriella megaspora]|nr:MAG: hypothetical protein M1820_010880 [Bogoriella megaspora]